MESTIQNLPYLCLIWMGIGFLIMLTSILMLARNHSKEMEYTHKLEKVFPMLMEQKENTYQKKEIAQNEIFEKIQELVNQGMGAEEIAKQLKIGVGEVKLMISLYAMK